MTDGRIDFHVSPDHPGQLVFGRWKISTPSMGQSSFVSSPARLPGACRHKTGDNHRTNHEMDGLPHLAAPQMDPGQTDTLDLQVKFSTSMEGRLPPHEAQQPGGPT